MSYGVYRHLASEVTGNGHCGQRGDKDWSRLLFDDDSPYLTGESESCTNSTCVWSNPKILLNASELRRRHRCPPSAALQF
jgi:hypothetical protein